MTDQQIYVSDLKYLGERGYRSLFFSDKTVLYHNDNIIHTASPGINGYTIVKQFKKHMVRSRIAKLKKI